MGTKKWNAVEFDAAKYLKTSIGSKLKFVELPKTMRLEVVIELDDELYADLAKNPSWLQKMQTGAVARAKSAMADLEKEVLAAEGKAQKLDSKAAEAFNRELQSTLEKSGRTASDDTAAACEKLLLDYKKGRKELAKFRLKCTGKILLTAGLVSGGAVVSVATAGALSPIGIWGVVKGAVAVAQEIAKLGLSANKMAVLVQGELAVLKKIMNEENAKAKKSGKVLQGGKEIGLNLFSKVLGVETPSLKNCQSHIDIHKIDISKIEKESKKLSELIYAAMDAQEKQAKALAVAKKTLPSSKVGKIAMSLEKIEKALDQMLNATIKVNEAIDAATDNQKKFQTALDGMKEGVPGWVKWVDVVGGLAIDIGVGCHDAATAVEKGYAIAFASGQAISNELVDAV